MQTFTRTNVGQTRAQRLTQRYNVPVQKMRLPANFAAQIRDCKDADYARALSIVYREEAETRFCERSKAMHNQIADELIERAEALEAELIEIDEAAREIGVSADTMRLENEISCLRVRLMFASGAELLDVRERLGAAREDLALTRWELMQ